MKKLISFIIAAMLVLAAPASVSAASFDSGELEKAILKVKSVVDIPEEASIFDYYFWDDPNEGSVLNLSWNDKNYEKSYYATVNGDGLILNFNCYEYKEASGIGALTRQQGQQIAESFLVKALPQDVGDFRLRDSYSSDRSFSYVYDFYMNGHPVYGMSFNIDVDMQTGRVTSYYGYSFVKKGDSFPAPSGMIGSEKAKEAFLGMSGVSLIYSSFYDYSERSINIFPSFTMMGNIFIDASTGKKVGVYSGGSPYFGAARDSGGAGNVANESSSLTPGEQKAVDNVAGLISKEAAVRSAVSKVPGLTSSAELLGANLSSGYEEPDKYTWHLQFKDYSVAINAGSGDLASFYYYGSQTGRQTAATRETAEKAALDFVEKNAPGKKGELVFSEQMSNTEIRPLQDGKRDDSSAPYVFVYVREANGVEFPGNYVSVSVDSASGRLTQYETRWFDNVEFPEISDVLGADGAFDVFAGDGKFDLLYLRAEDGKMALAYGFMDTPGYSVDPATGDRIGYDGKLYLERGAAVDSYGDIAGKWYEGTVKALLDNGYYLEGENFGGGEQITQEEFLRYLYSPMQSYYTSDDFYDMLERGKVVTKEEKAPGSALTRQDAAKFAIRNMGLDMAAKDGSIFRSMFRDTVAPSYTGYAALAKSLGIMQGDANGRFNGERVMTRAEAAVVVFNVLNNK